MSVNPSEDPSLAYLRALLVAAEGNPALQQSILFASLGGAADAQSSPQRPTLAASSPAPPVRRVSLSGPNGARRSSVRRMSVGEQRQALGPATEQPPRVWPSDARPRKSPERQIEIFVELARAYTWMHGRAHNRAASHAVITTSTVTVLSYVSGGLALGANGTSYATSLTLLAAVLSLLVGAIAAISKLKYFNFEAVAQQHASMLRQWNKLCDRRSGWAVRTFDPTLFKLPAPRRYRCRSISVSATALAVPEEKQSQPLVDLLADLFPMWGELSSDSQEILPMWVRAECAVAFKRDNPKALLPMICKDAKKTAGVAPSAAVEHRAAIQQHAS